jgi:hypothetical protein
MDYQRFLEHLPYLYEGWGTAAVRPRSPRFGHVLERVAGMTTANVLQLLNGAVGCLEEGEVYGEVGCFQGATLIGALLHHPRAAAVAADNFSAFDPQGRNEGLLRQHLAAFGLAERVRFHAQDFEDFLMGLRDEGIRLGVYLYDGAHDYRSQLMGLLLAVPLLAERALLVVDDRNGAAVQQATWDFLAARPECRLLLDLPTAGPGPPTFWNGLSVLGWDARQDHGYGVAAFRRARQPAVLESISKRPWVHVAGAQDGRSAGS